MLRALYSSVSGLQNHQTAMDVIGDNIANINTVGFKKSRVIFETLLSETMSNATAADDNLQRGGVNPVQVGLGSGVASIDKVFTQGSLMSTDKTSDLAIQGNGFFIYNSGTADMFSRAGNIDLDSQGFFVHTPTGMRLQGYQASRDPVTEDVFIDRDQMLDDMNIHGDGFLPGEKLPAQATTTVKYQSNLNSGAEPYETHNAAIGVFDELGNEYSAFMTFTKSNNDPNAWDYDLHLNLEDNQYVADVYSDPTTGLPVLKPLKLFTYELDGPDTNDADVTMDWNTFPFIHEDNGLSFSNPADLTNTPIVNADLAYTMEVTNFDAVAETITFSVQDSQGRIYRPYILDKNNPKEYVTDLESYDPAGSAALAGEAAIVIAAGGIIADRIAYTNPLPGEGFVLELDWDANYKQFAAAVVGPPAVAAVPATTVVITSHRSADTMKNVAYAHDFVTHENLNDPKNTSNVDQTTDIYVDPADTLGTEGQYSKRGHIVFDPSTGFIDESKSSIYNLSFWGVDDEGLALTSEPIEIAADFSKITQYNSPFTTAAREQNGYTMGKLETFNVDENGIIRGVYSNGYKMPLGQVALATFNNTGGLLHEGETMYTSSANSGNAFVTAANENGKGKISSGVLEMANVDLSKEFTDMIVIQRGFQANSRVISTADEMLQELVNLKR